jgi:hypothetical protein
VQTYVSTLFEEDGQAKNISRLATVFRRGKEENMIGRKMSSVLKVLLLALVVCRSAAAETGKNEHVLLGTGSHWRSHLTFRPVLMRKASGDTAELTEIVCKWRIMPAAVPKTFRSALPSGRWREADFDDSAWPRHHGLIFGHSSVPDLALICARGKFMVDDPSSVGELNLTASYRGGIVVYLNGKEAARAHLPKGDISMGAPAEDYPKEAFVDRNGKPLTVAGWSAALKERKKKGLGDFSARGRTLENVKIPSSFLREGVNVLAVEVHRSPFAEAAVGKLYASNGLTVDKRGRTSSWATAGLPSLTLASSSKPERAPLPAALRALNANPLLRFDPRDACDPCEPLRPVSLAAPRNGGAVGAIMVDAGKEAGEWKVTWGGLADGEGRTGIPKGATSVFFGRTSLRTRFGTFFDDLDTSAARNPKSGACARSQLLVVSVDVPAEAVPGEYRGKLTVSVDSVHSLDVPIELEVYGYVLPDARTFGTFVDMAQSPDSVALHYRVSMWSPEHMKLLDRTFSYLGKLGVKTLYVPLVHRTHLGNENSMVRWIAAGNGVYHHDFRFVEAYIDTAVKHLGKIPAVVFYVYEMVNPYYDKAPRGLDVTLLDARTGALEALAVPEWDSPDSLHFWKPVFEGLRRILKKRDMSDSMGVGFAADNKPPPETYEVLQVAAPEARWVYASHHSCSRLPIPSKNRPSLVPKPILLGAAVYGNNRYQGLFPAIRGQGWKRPLNNLHFPRVDSCGAFRNDSHCVHYHAIVELSSALNWRGVGRLGADFYSVPSGQKDKRGRDKLIHLFELHSWTQLALRVSMNRILCPGRETVMPTLRYYAMRTGIEEAATRIVLERMLDDENIRVRLGRDLEDRIRSVLDERTYALLYARSTGRGGFQTSETVLWYAGGARRRAEALYGVAEEAVRRLETVK